MPPPESISPKQPLEIADGAPGAVDGNNVQTAKTARAGVCAHENAIWTIWTLTEDPLREKNVVDQIWSGLRSIC
jgi:hypothetical protein